MTAEARDNREPIKTDLSAYDRRSLETVTA